jgi:hypothetical protein
MERRLGNGETVVGGLVTGAGLKTAVLLAAFAASMTGVLIPVPASAQVYGERPMRYGNTTSFFYDNRDDQRDFATNGVFPGNFAADPFGASVGAAGFIGSNPQHSAMPYPSQSYSADMRGRCPDYRIERASDGRRYIRCLTP